MPELMTAAPVSAAARGVAELGGHVLAASELSRLIGATAEDWARFARHWDELELDRYMGDGGTYRYRRYGHYLYDADTERLTALPHAPYHQDTSVNPLNGGIQRRFEPLTEAFAADPITGSVVRVLGAVFSAVEGRSSWDVKLHPFRIVTSAEQVGKPAPQGRHRDGGMFVTSLLVGRTNVSGGESSVYTDDGERIFAVTLREPGDQLLLDDRRLMHDVTPLHAVDPDRPAHRDVLIVDFDLPAA